MTDPADYSDPFINWNEENAANDDGEAVMAAEQAASGADPGHGDVLRVTCRTLAQALSLITVTLIGAATDPNGDAYGMFRYPEEAAELILRRLPEPGELEETAIMARLGRLNLDDPAAARRIVEWARKRWEDR